MWLNYGDVNGYDFWVNSYQIRPEIRKVHDGRIKNIKNDKLSSGAGEGSLVTNERWFSSFGDQLLSEKRPFTLLQMDQPTLLTGLRL